MEHLQYSLPQTMWKAAGAPSCATASFRRPVCWKFCSPALCSSVCCSALCRSSSGCPACCSDGNEVEIRIFLERSLDIVIGIEFIKMLAKHSPGSSLEVLLYAIARHLVVGHDSALENLLSVGAIALIFIVRKFFFVPAFGAHLPDGHPAPDLSPRQSGIPADAFLSRLKERAKAEVAEAIPSEEETFDEYDFEQAAPEPK